MTSVQYSFAAQVARAFLLAQYNDIVVFVEDVTCSSLYVTIINNALEGSGSISHVFPLQGRRAVIDAVTQYQPRKIPKPCVFLIDGDLDILSGKPPPHGPPLRRLNAYCIENLVLDPNAILEVAFESDANTDRSTLKAKLNIEQRINAAAKLLRPVFEMYAVAYLLGASVATVGFSVARLLKNDVDANSLCPQLCAARGRDIRRFLVANYGWEKVKETLNQIRRTSRSASFSDHMISGKDYLFPLVNRALRGECRCTDSTNSIKVRLARHSSIIAEPDLLRDLQALCVSAVAVRTSLEQGGR
jgi:hypothetical protein